MQRNSPEPRPDSPENGVRRGRRRLHPDFDPEVRMRRRREQMENDVREDLRRVRPDLDPDDPEGLARFRQELMGNRVRPNPRRGRQVHPDFDRRRSPQDGVRRGRQVHPDFDRRQSPEPAPNLPENAVRRGRQVHPDFDRRQSPEPAPNLPENAVRRGRQVHPDFDRRQSPEPAPNLPENAVRRGRQGHPDFDRRQSPEPAPNLPENAVRRGRQVHPDFDPDIRMRRRQEQMENDVREDLRRARPDLDPDDPEDLGRFRQELMGNAVRRGRQVHPDFDQRQPPEPPPDLLDIPDRGFRRLHPDFMRARRDREYMERFDVNRASSSSSSSPSEPEHEELPKSRCLVIEEKVGDDSAIVLRTVTSRFEFRNEQPEGTMYIYNKTPKSRKFKFYSPIARTNTSPWKGYRSYFRGKLLEKVRQSDVNQEDLFWYLDKLMVHPRLLEASGIYLRYKKNENRTITIEFLIKEDRILDKIEDFSPKMVEQFKHRTVVLLRVLIHGPLGMNDMEFEEPDEESEDFVRKKMDFDKFYKMLNIFKAKYNTEQVPMYSLRTDKLNCHLMPYQKDTIRWMIHRECHESDYDKNPMWNHTELVARNRFHYYPHLGAITRHKSEWQNGAEFMNRFFLKGGILADEMGLGKTVQVLSLISARRRGDEMVIRREESPERLGGVLANDDVAQQMRIAERSFAEMSSAKSANQQVCFSATESTQDPIDCTICHLTCSASICGWKSPLNEHFVCPTCHTKTGSRREIGTTLVILPEALIFQWFTEIPKHCSNDVKVMFYFGVKKHGYLQPCEMEKYDVILTTYDTLRAETNFSTEPGPRRQLRNDIHPPHYLTSSLIHVKFWRVIVDEAQLMPSCAHGKLSQMLLKIHADNWWCVTGTPLVKSVSDIFSTFHFLDLYPFCFQDYFQLYTIPQYLYVTRASLELPRNPLFETLARIMSRKTKQEVEEQMGLPKLEEIDRVVYFTAIEERQYKESKETVKNVVAEKLERHLSATYLADISCRDRVLRDLRNLRETILTGQHNGRHGGDVGSTNYIYAPETVIFRLLHLKKTEIKKFFRDFIGHQLGLAGVLQLGNSDREALKAYELALEGYQELRDAENNVEVTLGREAIKKACGHVADDVAAVELEDDTIEEEIAGKATGLLRSMKQVRRKFENSNNEDRRRQGESSSSSSSSQPKKRRTNNVELNPEQLAQEIAQHRREWEKEEKTRLAYSHKMAIVALMKAMKMDGTQQVHLILNMRKLQEKLEVTEHVETEQLNQISREYFDAELRCVGLLNDELVEWDRIWDRDFIAEMQPFFDEWHEALTDFKDPGHLTNGAVTAPHLNQQAIKGIVPYLPFNPLFHPSVAKIPVRHVPKTCMGGCTGYGEVGMCTGSTVSSTKQIVARTFSHIKELSGKIGEINGKLKRLAEMMSEMSDETNIRHFLTETTAATAPESVRQMLATLNCTHDIITGTQVQTSQVLVNRYLRYQNPCEICQVFTAINFLKFEAGYSTFHGTTRSKSGVLEFLQFLVKSFMSSIASGEHLIRRHAAPFFDRLHDYIKCQLNAVLICVELLNRFKELQQAQMLMTEEQLIIHTSRMNIPDGVNLREFYANESTRNAEEAMENVRKHLNEMRYLTNLVKEQIDGKTTEEQCPICQFDMDSFMVFTCGHRVCQECWDRLKSASRRENVGAALHEEKLKCPTCRVINKTRQVMIARNGHNDHSVIPGMIVSAKMTSAIILMREIIESNDSNKIILFTNTDPSSYFVWAHLQKILQMSQLPFSIMARESSGKKIVDFEVSSDKKVLLCSLSMCANGLNMTGANHIIFLDPPHLRSVLLQAIGRINRFGQKREMKVYHMIVDGSLDVELRNMAKKKTLEERERRGWTCGDIRAMFDIPSHDRFLPVNERPDANRILRMVRAMRQAGNNGDGDDDDIQIVVNARQERDNEEIRRFFQEHPNPHL